LSYPGPKVSLVFNNNLREVD